MPVKPMADSSVPALGMFMVRRFMCWRINIRLTSMQGSGHASPTKLKRLSSLNWMAANQQAPGVTEVGKL